MLYRPLVTVSSESEGQACRHHLQTLKTSGEIQAACLTVHEVGTCTGGHMACKWQCRALEPGLLFILLPLPVTGPTKARDKG